MRTVFRALLAAAALATSVLVFVLVLNRVLAPSGDEDEIPPSKLPRPVAAAVKEKYAGAKLVSATREEEEGETYYSVILKQEGQTLEVSFTPEGEITEIAKEIDVTDLPRPVLETLEKKYPGATVKEAAEVTDVTDKNRISYHLEVEAGDEKTIELQLTPKGKILKKEAKGRKGG